MPSVNSNDLILLIPELVNINRGVSSTFQLTLHQNFVGNFADIVNLNDLTIKVVNNAGSTVKTLKKSDSTNVRDWLIKR